MPARRLTFVCLFLLPLLIVSGAEKRVIQPRGFQSGAPFSPGILVDGTLYVSGQVGRNLETGKVPEDFESEVRQCLDNISLILREARMTIDAIDDVVAVQVYLTDMDLFSRMNTVYMKYFSEPRPARTTVGVARLAGAFRIEITVTAKK